MATGDLAGNVQRVVDALHAISYPRPVSSRGLREGDPRVLLPILHFVMLEYSPHVSRSLHATGEALYALSDADFTSRLLHFTSSTWGVTSHLSQPQLLAPRGYAERKLIFTVQVIHAAQRAHATGERAAQVRRTTLPYTAALDETTGRQVSSSSRGGAAVQVEREPLLPVSGGMYPPSAPFKSSVIYSTGSAVQVEEEAQFKFLTDAVACGRGANGSRLESRLPVHVRHTAGVGWPLGYRPQPPPVEEQSSSPVPVPVPVEQEEAPPPPHAATPDVPVAAPVDELEGTSDLIPDPTSQSESAAVQVVTALAGAVMERLTAMDARLKSLEAALTSPSAAVPVGAQLEVEREVAVRDRLASDRDLARAAQGGATLAQEAVHVAAEPEADRERLEVEEGVEQAYDAAVARVQARGDSAAAGPPGGGAGMGETMDFMRAIAARFADTELLLSRARAQLAQAAPDGAAV